MVGIIVKKYEHFNTSLPNWDSPKGKYIRTKDQYDREVKQAGMISYEKSQENEKNRKLKDYKISDKALSIIKSAKLSKNSRGEVKLSDRTVEAMKEIGAINKKIPNYMKLPKSYEKKGGFS